MSSNYKAICLGHDPAIVIASGSNYREWGHPSDALSAVDSRQGALEDHPECDIVIGRYSSPIIEVGCPPRSGHLCTHSDPRWIDVGWLRLMLAALDDPNPAATQALDRLRRGCWHPDRVRRLRNLITE